MTDRSRVPADDDPRRQTDEAADQDVAAAERVVADHRRREPLAPGVINAAAHSTTMPTPTRKPRYRPASMSDPLSERNLADPAFDAGLSRPDLGQLAEDEPGLEEKVAAAAGAAATGDIAGDRGTATGARPAGQPRPACCRRWVLHRDSAGSPAAVWVTSPSTTPTIGGAPGLGVPSRSRAVLVLATGMIWSWIGGLHSPQPKNIPVAVVASDPVARRAGPVRQNTEVLEAEVYATAADASNALNKRQGRRDPGVGRDAARRRLEPDRGQRRGPGVADTVATTIGSAAQNVNVPLAVEDAYPFSAGDSRGLTPFWLTLAWILGGLLAAVALGVAVGTVPRDLDRLGMRLGALAVFSLLLGLLGAVFAGPFLGVWHQHTVGCGSPAH